MAVAFGETHHPYQRALAAQNREDRHQEQPPLREANALGIRQQSGNALRKLIRSLAEAGVVAGWEATGQERFPRTTP